MPRESSFQKQSLKFWLSVEIIVSSVYLKRQPNGRLNLCGSSCVPCCHAVHMDKMNINTWILMKYCCISKKFATSTVLCLTLCHYHYSSKTWEGLLSANVLVVWHICAIVQQTKAQFFERIMNPRAWMKLVRTRHLLMSQKFPHVIIRQRLVQHLTGGSPEEVTDLEWDWRATQYEKWGLQTTLNQHAI